MKELRIHLRDISESVVTGWRSNPSLREPEFRISQGDIFLAGPHDAIVAAGNSLGIMDGGLDLVYRSHFGMELQDALRTRIKSHWNGFLPVGAAEVIATENEPLPRMIYVPTMERPSDVRYTWNAYLAFKAALWAAVMDPRIKTVLCPGLCTLTGRMDPKIAAGQMARAWHELGLSAPDSYPWT